VPERLDTSVTVTFVPGEGITKGAISVRGEIAGLDAASFAEAASAAKDGCPVSQALTGIPEVTVDASLA
jgi:osmotically inducible protein OsmC